MRKLRLAFFTPLNPQRNGISDYSEDLLPHLGALADIDVVIGPYSPSNEAILRQFKVIRPETFLQNRFSYDAAIYQIGNHFRHHSYMIPCLRAVPGIVVLHDYCLQYLVLGLTIRQGNLKTLERILKPAYGRRSSLLAKKLLFSLVDPNEMSFARPLVQWSKAVIVHNHLSMQSVVREFPGKLVRAIPMGVPIEEIDQSSNKSPSRFGFCEDDFILASVSTVSCTKRLDLVLAALRELVTEFPQIKFLILGHGSLGDRAREMIEEPELRGKVIQKGWLSKGEYTDLISLADVVIDLRYPSGAETSASLSRALAAGKPAIVSAHGSFLELPDECCLKIPIHRDEVKTVKLAIRRLVESPGRRLRMGEAARLYARTHLRLERSAYSYMEFISEVLVSPGEEDNREDFLDGQASVLNRLVLSSVYKFFRLAHLYRTYGFSDTMRRIREEIHATGNT